MWARAFAVPLLLLSLLCSLPSAALGREAAQAPLCLILYASPMLENTGVMVGNLTRHFSMERIVKPAEEVREEELAAADYIIVIQQEQGDPALMKRIRESTADRQSVILWMGASGAGEKRSGLALQYKGKWLQERNTVYYPLPELAVLPEPAERYVSVTDGTNSYPLTVRSGREWYHATTQLSSVPGLVYSDLLHDVFGRKHSGQSHEAFIRIEDVHPMTDPAKLRAIADLLHTEGVPFMVAVIPVFSDANGTSVLSFEDKPEWTEALHYMVERGGSLILHGYEHRYRSSETGEGFEFWDSEADAPIAEEEAYTRSKLQKGIARMAAHGLYPLAFEPPHYAMSQQGYRLARDYFSTLVAQLQVNDSTYTLSQKVPYRLPASEEKLQFIPETIGYVEKESPAALLSKEEEMQKVMTVRDSVIGAFYHPIIPLEKLRELVAVIKSENVDFIDLRYEANTVDTSFIRISSGKDGVQTQITDEAGLQQWAAVQRTSVWMNYLSLAITWGIAVVVGGFIALFFYFLWSLRRRKKVRLFGEDAV